MESRISRIGSPAWIRTTIHGSKGRCPTIRRPGNVSLVYLPPTSPVHPLQCLRKAIWTGVRDGLQDRSAALAPLVCSIRTVFRHVLPLPPLPFVCNRTVIACAFRFSDCARLHSLHLP